MHVWLPIYLLWLSLFATGDPISAPEQPAVGPGGAVYLHHDVLFSNLADEADGYWLFEPADPKPDSAQVVVFLHGYGAINPMIYGAWIRHIVRKGNIVIYPRYQKNLFSPRPDAFADNAATAIRQALEKLSQGEHVRPIAEPLIIAGHSYGGTIAANLGVNYAQFGIPQPKGLLLCAPGTGPLKGGRLVTYEALPEDTRLLVLVSINDHVVGEELGRLIFETATNTPARNLIRLLPDDYGTPPLTSVHNESYALDAAFDAGIHNASYHRSLSTAKLDAADFYAQWKLLDALSDCLRRGENCHLAFGDTPEQRYMGAWSDGTPVRELEVIVPPVETVGAGE
jgi:pimeloyl-ACP methyl ester carboxylesterase